MSAQVISLARYNKHKRRTLDRVTQKHSRKLTRAVKKYYQDNLDDILDALNRGDSSYKGKLSGTLENQVEEVLTTHRKDTIYIGVADGLQEVPEKESEELNQWANYPLGMPIENTLCSLGKKRAKDLATIIEERMGSKKPRFFMDLIDQSKKDILKQVKNAYKNASKDWIAGESTIDSLKESLSRSIDRTKSGLDRVFRTETTRYFNESRVDYFSSVKTVSHYQIFAITDGRVSKICNSRHGFVIEASKSRHTKYLPPFHPNCRTVLRPLINKLSRHKILIEKGMAMNESSFPKLPKGWAA